MHKTQCTTLFIPINEKVHQQHTLPSLRCCNHLNMLVLRSDLFKLRQNGKSKQLIIHHSAVFLSDEKARKLILFDNLSSIVNRKRGGEVCKD